MLFDRFRAYCITVRVFYFFNADFDAVLGVINMCHWWVIKIEIYWAGVGSSDRDDLKLWFEYAAVQFSVLLHPDAAMASERR